MSKHAIDPAALVSRALWDATMRTYLAAKAASDEYELTDGRPDYDAVIADALYQREHDAGGALVAIPAPDAAAIAWKADYLFGSQQSDDSLPCYSMAYVGPFLADIQRLAAA